MTQTTPRNDFGVGSTLNRADLSVGDTVAGVPVKSKLGSKTNITAVLLLLFGIFTATGTLPAAVADPAVVGGVVAAGAVLVAYFRTVATAILK